MAQKYLKDRPPTEAELRAEFDTQLASTPLVEYHARHILVSSQDVAQKVIDQLKGGGDFATLAQAGCRATRARRPRAATSTGSRRMPWSKNFSDAVALLKNGEVTKHAGADQYGWHVIQLLGTRDRPPPNFEGVQDQLKRDRADARSSRAIRTSC